MSVVSTSLAQQVYNWQLEDFACFRKCGEITVSPDAQTYGMNCRFCPGICLQFDVFIEHMREVHAERVSALYQQTEACGEWKCEQSTQTQTQTQTEMATYNDYVDDDAAFIAAIANHTADDDFDIDVECIDGDECAFNCNYNNAVDAGANVGSDTDTDSAANTTAQASPAPRRYPQRQRRRTAVANSANEDKPRKLCSWNEASSAKYNGTLGKFKTLTNTQTPPTPAPTPSPWTTPVQNVKEGATVTAVENESETATIAMDTPGTLNIRLGAHVDMAALLGDDVEMQAHSVPEAPQEQVDLVYIMESATPDGAIEEETVVDPFEMAQGWRRSTDSSECPENNVPSPYSSKELRKNLIALPLNALKTQNCEKPLVNENEHSTEVIFYLLEAYKKNEKLWNPNHSQYKYNANRKMFEELSRPLLRDMNYSLDGSEIYAIIKSLRSRYRLELAKARERKGKYKTRFKYFEKMEFLRDIIENKRAARRVKKQLDSSITEKALDEDYTESTRSTHNRTVLTYLLDAFRGQETLWNPQHPNYLLCNKNELMHEISTKLLLEKDVTMTADECSTEIQKLRTRFRRELRIVHEQKGLYAPKLWCFEQMEFLQKIFEDQLCDRLKKRKGVIACKPKIQYLKAKSIEFKSDDDHLTFIEIYKSYSALWDVDHPDYRSTTYRNEELNQMLEEVNLMLGIDSTLEELQKTLYEMRKEFSAEKHKRLVETTQTNTTPPLPPQSIIQTKLMEFLDVNLGPFRCDVCSELIKTSDQYKIHKSGHDGMQPFICTLCGKGFQIPGNLTIHIRRHKGDFPYACAVCDKKFATSTEVAIHMRSHTAPKYQTAYACEGKKLTIECDPGDLINLIRANYGRFSITICNDHGNVEWSVNCMFPKSLTVLNSKCAHKQSCSVLATTSMFGDPCLGTHKYLEAHYQCISAAQTSTTTNRPSPPWVLANNPPLLANGSTLINPSVPLQPQGPGRLPLPANGAIPSGGLWHTLPPTPGPPQPTLPGGRLKGNYNTTVIKNSNRHDGLPPPPPLHHHHHAGHHATSPVESVNAADSTVSNTRPTAKNDLSTRTPGTNQTKSHVGASNTTTTPNTRILSGVGGSGTDDGSILTAKTAQNRGNQQQSTATQQQAAGNNNNNVADASGGGNGIRTINNINNLNMGLGAVAEDESNMFCGPTNARNLFWNITRVGDVNVQPCPGGATGIAKWRCVLMKRVNYKEEDDGTAETTTMRAIPRANCSSSNANSSCENAADRLNQRIGNFEPTWHPMTPDLTQCRSLWLNSLEVRVNQRESSVISIANDLSEVTSSKTLYGGDMLVTTKIIQTMSEKMFHDKETLPDQRQREAIILELLHGVVKTGSNLLDESQLSSWMDLNQEDQMRVATSLLTGLEYNAFLLADTIIRERNIVQKVKNILLSVRVLETKNIQGNEVFPDLEQWQISDDRIELPRTALVENSEGGLVRIVFAAFDRLESILKPSYDHFDTKSSRSYVRNTALLASERNDSGANADLQQQRIRILNSKVISASLGKGRHIQLSQPIKLVLRHIKTENVTNPTCVFWNYIDHAWSANGCSLESTNRTHSICMCNHLTNFAILMDVMDEHNHSLFGVFDGNMRILIYISVAICLVFVVIALLTLKLFNGVFIKSARTSIYRSIYICLLFIEILFLIGIEQNETSILCGFTTVFLHCSILSAIAWFCFEAFQSYSTLTTDDMLLEVDQTSKVNCYYLLSYGLSLTIVAISLVINPNTYTQNDFCVLMEANMLFYSSFVAPVLLFLLGALGYTFLSWVIMCRKSHTTLKNKEHTRLANVRFDMRCSFIFLLLLSAVWISAYYYLRLAKVEDDVAIVCGYLFISFNTLMGLYIFVFHCIQNEKIRREYRKYVRQNSWLPKCLRCSKASISSGIVGNSGIGGGSGSGGGIGTGNGGGSGGALSGTHRGNSSAVQLKKTKLPIGSAGLVSDDTGGIISAADDAIIASSDCELNDARNLSLTSNADMDAVKSAGGNITLQHGKGGHSIIDTMQGHIVLERGGANAVHSVGGSGGLRTPSAGHTSPTSSAGSTHLIFGGQKQQMIGSGISTGGGPQEAYYHQPDYYGWKQQMGKPSGGNNNALSLAHPRDYVGNAPTPQQAHEFFYWTQKHQPHGKKKRGSGIGGESPSGSLHSRTTAASQQILFYPSYKKTALKQQQQQQYPHYDEAVGAAAYYQQQQQQQQQQHRRHASAAMMLAAHHQQQQQLSSDEEQLEPAAAAHAHLLHLGRRAGSQLPPPPAPASHAYHYPHHHSPEFMGAAHTPTQRYYRNKHSNCDLSHEEYDPSGRAGSEQYYNQNSMGGDGPVYEEILSNRNSDVQHYEMDLNMYGRDNNDDDDDDDDVHDCDDDEVVNDVRGGGSSNSAMRRQQLRQRHHYEAARNGVVGAGVGSGGKRYGHAESGASSEDDDDDDDDEENESAQHRGLPQGDERMRRLIALQDEEFQRRFQRQRKKAESSLNDKTATAYFDHHNAAASSGAAVFGISGGGSGGASSIRAIKKISPNNRIGVHELFTTTHNSSGAGGGGGSGLGPPLPPANQQQAQQQQYPLPKRQQLSPTTLTATTPSSSHTQPIIGRNISAMLDENNTVRCYLEPLPK